MALLLNHALGELAFLQSAQSALMGLLRAAQLFRRALVIRLQRGQLRMHGLLLTLQSLQRALDVGAHIVLAPGLTVQLGELPFDLREALIDAIRLFGVTHELQLGGVVSALGFIAPFADALQ